jgi:actin related protein 2/3 complex subunit 1A/1B
MLAEYTTSGWVHDVSWSPSGNKLAFVAHDSRVYFVDITNGQIEKLSLEVLPYRACMWVAEDAVIAAGFDCSPQLFTNAGGWKFARNLDQTKTATSNKQSGTGAARAMFQAKVEYGTTDNETTLNTQHQNAISSLRPFAFNAGKVAKFSTTGVDGKLIIWTV